MRVFIGKDVDSILNPGFLEKLMINDNNYDLDRLNKITSKEYHYHSLNSAYAENTLEVIDRNVASFDIEARYPFYDKRLVEFCYALPTEMKLKFGWGKYILRLAMENILPVEIQWRNSKTDLSPSYEKNFLLFEKDTLKRLIYNENQLISDYINLEKFKDILNKRASEGEQDLFDVWLVVLLDLWLKYADISS
jgi:asparagine synthase (glutamine-hydrolysing)